MKVSLIFNVVLLLLVGVLFYLHFSSKNVEPPVRNKVASATTAGDFKIAYFELDSITNTFEMVKDVKAELGREESKMNNEMNQWQKRYMEKRQDYQRQAEAGMSQVQSENATRDMMQMEESIRQKQQEMEQRYQKLHMQKMEDVRTRIQDYLKEYNRTRGYSYILGYEPGFIYYRDSVFNITNDLVKGLNEQYKKK